MEFISELLGLIQELTTFISRWVYVHNTVVYLVSTITAAFCAVILLALYNRVVPSKWGKWFGLAFVVFTIQYGVPFGINTSHKVGWLSKEGVAQWSVYKDVLVAFCSCANNLFFLATARALTAARDLADDSELIPKWAWAAAAVSLVSLLELLPERMVEAYPVLLFVRMPDALFSAYCLVVLGYATANYVSIREWNIKTLTALAIALLYAGMQIVYGLNPLLAQTNLLDNFIFIPAQLHSSSKLPSIDYLAFAIVTPLKFLLFFNVYMILIRQLSTFKRWRTAVHEVINGRVEFTSSYDGLVGIIGKMLEADVVDLSIKLPGRERLPGEKPPNDECERVASIEWKKAESQTEVRELRTVVKLLRAETERHQRAEAVIGWCIESGNTLTYPSSERTHSLGLNPFKSKEKLAQFSGNGTRNLPPDVEAELLTKKSLMIVPVIYHGAVIGCLKVEKERKKFNDLARLLLRDTANLASLSIQSFRELAALDKFSFEFTRLQADEKKYRADAAQNELSNILQDILSPVVARLKIDFGFETYDPAYSGDPKLRKLVVEAVKGLEYDNLPDDIEVPDWGYLKLLKTKLKAKSLDRKEYELGELFLTAWSDKDKQVKPVLSTNYLHRKTVGSFTVDSFFDFSRDYFSHILKELALKLNKEQINLANWVNDIESTAKDAGLLWAVASQEGSDALLGNQAAFELVDKLRDAHGDSMELKHWLVDDIKEALDERNELTQKTRYVIGIYLSSQRYLWFGVSRPGFGAELSFASPWKMFLEHLAEVADASLVRFTAALDLEGLQLEAARSYGLAAVSFTTGSLAHTLKDMIREQLAYVVDILEDINQGLLRTEPKIPRRLHPMKEKAEQTLKMLEALTDITKIDDSRPCSLSKAKNQAMALFKAGLMANNVKITESIAPQLMVDVPLYVVALTFINLIGNAKDAVGKNGAIVIEAEDRGDVVVCHVKDTGPGIVQRPPESIFKLGVTTKPRSGGWGLYLVYKLLRDYGATIEVTDPRPTKTTFTITFPKIKQEEP